MQTLREQGLIKPFAATKEEIRNCLELAKRDASVSRQVLDSDSDWAFNIAYNAMLQAARAWMFSKGYRPAGEAAHAAVVTFLEATAGNRFQRQVTLLDMMRRKRHRAVYDQPGTISSFEAQEAVKASAAIRA